MLSRAQIQELNHYMLGLGEPVDLDYTGYNRPDWNRNRLIGALRVELSEEECFCVLQSLRHYTGRQLIDYKEEIEETYSYYENLLKDFYADEVDRDLSLSAVRSGSGHTKSDYTPKELEYVGEVEDGVLVRFTEYVSALPDTAKWVKVNGSFAVYVRFVNLEEFIEDIKQIGECGYVLGKAVLNAFARYQARNAAPATIEKAVLTDENKENQYHCLLFSINRYSRDFSDLLWKGRAEDALSYVNPVRQDPPKTEISVKKTQLKKLKKFCEANDIDASAIDRRFEKEAYEKAHKNDSGNTLVDVSSLTLPFQPYPFQVEDAKEIVSRKRALIGHDMGCGKTFIASLVGMSIDTPKLVICPESLRLNWFRELSRFHQGADIKLVYSKDKTPEFGKDWTIMGYKTAVKHRNVILAKRIDCVFVDESHACKAVNNMGDPASQQAKTIIEVTKYATYTYLMTGTPMPTRPKDLYNELGILGVIDTRSQTDYGQPTFNFHRYGTKFCGAVNNGFGWDYSGASNKDELHELLSTVMTRRLKKEVLPNLTKQRQFIPLDETSAEYRKIEARLHDLKDGDTYMGLAMTGRRALSAVKVKPTLDLAESFLDQDQAVVIVTEFNESMDAFLEAYTDKDGICHASCIRGGMKDEEKQKSIDDFQSGKNKVCIVNTIAGGVGVTLTAAHNMIVCDYDWTPANMTQVEDRICRAGQTECCNIYYMFCENAILDRVFVDMISDKSEIIDRVIDNAENTVDLSGTKANNSSYLDALKARLAAEGVKTKKKHPYGSRKKKTEPDGNTDVEEER